MQTAYGLAQARLHEDEISVAQLELAAWETLIILQWLRVRSQEIMTLLSVALFLWLQMTARYNAPSAAMPRICSFWSTAPIHRSPGWILSGIFPVCGPPIIIVLFAFRRKNLWRTEAYWYPTKCVRVVGRSPRLVTSTMIFAPVPIEYCKPPSATILAELQCQFSDQHAATCKCPRLMPASL